MARRPTDNRWRPEAAAVRKHRVAQLLVRGMREHEIVQTLSQETRQGSDGFMVPNPSYTVNPKTDHPYTQQTINNDIRELKAEWRNQSAEAVNDYYGHMIATTLEVQRSAWARGDLDTVLQANGELRAIIGKPIKTENYNLNIDPKDLTNEQIDRLLQGESLQSVLHKEELRD
jgi:hypothetical protein